MELVWIWLGAAGIVSFVLFGVDKSRARRGEWRIPERVLLGSALLGGGLGALLGMRVFRHKTKHLKFLLGVPFCIVLNGLGAYLLYTYVF